MARGHALSEGHDKRLIVRYFISNFTFLFTHGRKAIYSLPSMGSLENPLTASPPREIWLPNAPLVRVITQISFPPVVSISKPEFIAPFQEALRSVYPVLRPEQAFGFVFANVPAATPPTPQTQTTWRFNDSANAWRVSLAPNFLAIETTAYKSKVDFVERASLVVNALGEHINPQVVDRIGLRFIDRVVGAPIKNLDKFVRSEVVGVLMSEAAPSVQHALSECLFDAPKEDAQFLARWGRLPSNATHDPAAVEGIGEPSWILDLDMFSTKAGAFTAKNVLERIGNYADRIYTFFRWAVTDEFLKLYGGTLG